MSKPKNAPAAKTKKTEAVEESPRGWLKLRTGLLFMAGASILFGIYVLIQVVPVEGWGKGLQLAGLYMAMMWGVFGIMQLFFRLTRRR